MVNKEPYTYSKFSAGTPVLESHCEDERKAVVWSDKNWTNPPTYSIITLTRKEKNKVVIPYRANSLKINEELGLRLSTGTKMYQILPVLATTTREIIFTLDDSNEIIVAEDFLNLYNFVIQASNIVLTASSILTGTFKLMLTK